MNVLIYSVVAHSPHMEADLELAKKLRKEGNKVTIVRCTGQLRSCLVNPNHNKWICASCISKYDKAIRLAELGEVEIITLPITNTAYDFLPKSFENIEQLKAYRFKGMDAGVAVASTLIGRFNKDHKFDTVKYRSAVATELSMWIDICLALEKMLLERKPDAVYFFNGRFSSLHPLKSLCIRDNITFYTHERGGILNKYIVRKNAMPHNIEYTIQEINDLWIKGKNDKEEIGSKFFEDRRNRVIQSWISFTEFQKEGLLPQGFDSRKKNIAIFNSTMEEYEGMADWQNPIYKDDNEGIRQVLESFKDEKDFMFYLRVHPNLKFLRNSQINEILEMGRKYKNVCLIGASETQDSYALMESVDKVITLGSTMGAEATYWNKVSILLGKSMYMNLDICYEPSTHSEVVTLIKNENLQPKPKENAIKYGYWELEKGEWFETFQQLDVYKMTCKGQVIEPNRALGVMEKIAKLRLVRNGKDIDTVKHKIKSLMKWN